MPSSNWFLDNVSASKFAHSITGIGLGLRSILGSAQATCQHADSYHPKALANLFFLPTHHRLNRQLHTNSLRRKPNPLLIRHVHARVISLNQRRVQALLLHELDVLLGFLGARFGGLGRKLLRERRRVW